MIRHREVVTTVLVLLVLLVAAPACKKKAPETEPAKPAVEATRPPEPPSPPKQVEERPFPTESEPTREELDLSAEEVNRSGVLKTVYFAYDSSELSAEARATLQANAAWFAEHREFSVVIEGHCDERGTIEYNLALGDRRANAVRDYLVNLGLERSRARTVSYGEERPEQLGHDESAWSRNRRAAFVAER